MSDFLGFIGFSVNNFGLLLDKTIEHLAISSTALLIAIIIGMPIGLWLGHIHKGEFIAVSISNLGRALPSLALIAILIGVVGIGFTNVVIALIVLAAPPILTTTFLGVNGVDRSLTQASRGMGLRGWQTLARVELPLALPSIFTGLRTSAVLVVSSATLAAIAGGGGLGDIILNQVAYGMSGVIAGALWVAVLALATDGLFIVLHRLVTPAGIRSRTKKRVDGPLAAPRVDDASAPEEQGVLTSR